MKINKTAKSPEFQMAAAINQMAREAFRESGVRNYEVNLGFDPFTNGPTGFDQPVFEDPVAAPLWGLVASRQLRDQFFNDRIMDAAKLLKDGVLPKRAMTASGIGWNDDLAALFSGEIRVRYVYQSSITKEQVVYYALLPSGIGKASSPPVRQVVFEFEEV